MLESLHALSAICTTDSALQGGLLLGLFAAGAVGSIAHCGPMCGAFVLGQVSERMLRVPAGRLCERRRVSHGLLLPYHLGRLTTYAGLGAVAAGSAGLFARLPWFAAVSSLLLALAALLFLSHALGGIFPSIAAKAPRGWGRMLATITAGIPRGSAAGEFLFGLTLGFLPCGFLYAAIAAAAATARPELGAAAMVAFGLGTAPVLMLIGIAGQSAGRRWNRGVTAVAPVLMLMNAALLLVIAWQRLT